MSEHQQQHAVDVAVATAVGIAQASGGRIAVRLVGDVPDEVKRALFLSGAVARTTTWDALSALAVVALDEQTDLRALGYEHEHAVVLFDPVLHRPIDVRRRVAEAWPDHQARVLPLEGDGALTEGVVVTLPAWSPRAPRVAVSMPVNMEENDVERVLASFLPVAEEWVVGVDEKSTDRTLAIVERYCDVVFRFSIDPWSFAEARNRGLDKCSSLWIFSTEGHEHLDPRTVDALLIAGDAKVKVGSFQVHRDTGGQVFQVPSLFRNHPRLRFTDTNGVHNTLEVDAYGDAIGFDGATCWRPPAPIRTIHKAHPVNRALRARQREGMNPQRLDEYVAAGGARKGRGLFYAAQEHASAGNLRLACRRMLAYLKTDDGFHEQVYEGYLMLAEWLGALKRYRAAIWVGRLGLRFNLQRCELEFLLADLHCQIGDQETARQLFAKAAGVPMPAHSLLFLRKEWYRHLPWRGLAGTSFNLGEHRNAVNAARAALSFGVPDEMCEQIVARADLET